MMNRARWMIAGLLRPCRAAVLLCAVMAFGAGPGAVWAEPVAPERYAGADALFATVAANVAQSPRLEQINTIDHSRLGADAGAEMPPAQVMIFSDSALETALVQINPLIAIDLPLRVLAYETAPGGPSTVIYNSFAFLQARYGLPDADAAALSQRYAASVAEAVAGIGTAHIGSFPTDQMQPDGITTLESPFDFDTTVARLRSSIDAQDDTVWFGEVDFQTRAAAQGVPVPPALLLLFGGPAPGAKAMADAPTLGLDAFCQKLLVWAHADGGIRVSYNDLLALAERQQVRKTVALRGINFRLNRTFEGALTP